MSWLLSALPSIPGWSTTPNASDGDGNGASSNAGDFASKDLRVGDKEENDEEYDDTPPQFPLPDSAQRSGASSLAPSSSLAVPAPSFALAPPSPTTSTHSTSPPSDLNIAMVDAPLGDMRLPHSTTARPTFGITAGGGLVTAASDGKGAMPPPPPHFSASTASAPANGSSTPKPKPPSTLAPAQLATLAPAPPLKKKGRGKVALAPGCSALDWARLAKSGVNMRGFNGPPMRVTMEELKKHKTSEDAWSAFNGVVYNITPYLRFHPGGEDELMRVAGRDGTKLFMLTHSWVNIEHLMQECMVGMLVRG